MLIGAQFAGFWIRAFALLIDGFLLDCASIAIQLMILGAIYWVGVLYGLGAIYGLPGSTLTLGEEPSFYHYFDSFSLQIMLLILRGVLSFFYFTWANYRFGTTLGKRIFGIRVVSARDGSHITLKQSISRCLGYLISYLPLGGGFIIAAFHPQKRSLHDIIADTVTVVSVPPEKLLHLP